ncbi:MAG: hypothetical protein EOM72_02510 [Opitutae bacterium]|nr:hypothetical protein [Opitutae bacterium]
MPAAPPSPKRFLRWAAGLLLAGAAASPAATHAVPFSVLLPEAERVYLLGSFNGWTASADALMTNDHGVWRKTLSLENGEYAYKFKAEGDRISGAGWRIDWKASRESEDDGKTVNSLLAVPGDLDSFRARQRRAEKTERGIEIPLFYDRYPANEISERPGGYSFAAPLAAPPAGEWILPAFVDDHPLFTVVPLGDAKILAILDRNSAEAPFYNRIHFDRNANRDLTDDPPIDGEAQAAGDRYFYCSFPPVDLEIESGGHRLPYSLRIQAGGVLPETGGGAPDEEQLGHYHFTVFPHCAYLGEFMLEGVGYRIALGDSVANGTFDDQIRLDTNARSSSRQLYAEGDSLYVSTDDRVGGWDGLLLGNHLAIGSRLFDVHLDVPGGKLTLEERTERVGAIEFSGPVESMSMLAASGGQGLMLRRVGARASVPAGVWRLIDYQIAKPDEWGDRWILRASGGRKTPALAVPDRKTVPLAIGEPLRAVVDVSDAARQQAAAGRSLKMDLAILGNAQEIVSDVLRASGTRTQHKLAKRRPNRPAEAAYRIIQPDGERVASGSFEYG